MPEFLNKRRLIALDDLDVTRDIFDLKFLLKSDMEPEDIKYFLLIQDWTPTELKVKVNFTNPLLISNGQFRDSV